MDENNELVASETDAYAIADFINLHFLKSFWETRSPSEKAAMPTATTSLFFFAASTIWSAHFMSVSTFSSPCTRSFQLMHAANAFFSPSVFARLAAAIVAALAPSSSRRRLTLSARLSGAATAALGLLAPLAASGAGAGFSGGDAAAS